MCVKVVRLAAERKRDADSSQRCYFSTFARAERRHEGAMATWHRRQAGGQRSGARQEELGLERRDSALK